MELLHSQVQARLRKSRLRAHRERTRVETWARRGFLPEERYWLSEISKAGAVAPYIRNMIIYRTMHLLNNKKRYGWSEHQYRLYVAAHYERLGVRPRSRRENVRSYILATFYDYLEVFKKKVPAGIEYESPKKKSRRRGTKGGSKPQTTKRRQLRQKIDELNDRIVDAMRRGDRAQRFRLENQRNRYQVQLDRLR